jgi:IS5 family transposase
MQDTLFPEYFIEKLQNFGGLLGIPLQILKRLIRHEGSEVLDLIREDQSCGLQRKYEKRYGARERSFGGPSVLDPEVVLYFAVARAFNSDCFGERGYCRLLENSSLQYCLGCFEMSRFPGRSTIHEHLGFLSVETLEELNKLILSAVASEGLDDFFELTIDSTSIRSLSTWPLDSELLFRLFTKAWEAVIKPIERFKVKGQKSVIDRLPLKSAGNLLKGMRQVCLEISFSKGKKGAKKARFRGYRKLLSKAEKLWVNLGRLYDRLCALQAYAEEEILEVEKVMQLCDEKLFFVQKRFKMAEDADMGYMDPELLLSLSDEDAAFINKGGRETVFGYRPGIGRSAAGFITALFVEPGNVADSKAFVPTLAAHIRMTGQVPMAVSTDDGYASSKNERTAQDLGVDLVSFSGAKGRTILGEDLWEEEPFRQLRVSRAAAEAAISHLKWDYNMHRMTVGGINAVRKEILMRIIAFNLENFARRLKEKKRPRPKEKRAA